VKAVKALKTNGDVVDISEIEGLANADDAAPMEGEDKLITRGMIQRELAQFDLMKADADARFQKAFGTDQDLFTRRSTSSILGLILKDATTLSYIMGTYRDAAAEENRPVDMPTPEELLRFQTAMGVGVVGFALEVGLFAGALLGRGGLNNDEVLRLMDEPAFMHQVLTLSYRAEDICNLARETIEKLDAMLGDQN
jgi:hypothetical protein